MNVPRLSVCRTERVAERTRRGAAAVEFAVVVPFFLILVFGMIDFGRAMMISQVIQNASREGARLASTDGATGQMVTDRVNSYLNGALGLSPGEITTNISVEAGLDNPAPTAVANASPGDQCTVQVLVPYNQIAIFKIDYFSNAKLRGYASMRREW